MTDLEEIQRVLNAYARNVDDGTPEKLVTEVYAPDADVDTGFGHLLGVEHLASAYAAEIDKLAATAHMNTNFEIDVDGDTARSTTYVTFWFWPLVPGEDRAAVPGDMDMYVGQYMDRWVQRPEGWRITHRRFRKFGPTTSTGG